MRWAYVFTGLCFAGVAIAARTMLTPPLAVPELPEGKTRVAERHFLSEIGKAGKKVFSGGCADCHGQDGLGGDGPRLDTKAFARDFRRRRELHMGVDKPIPAHEELGIVLGPVGSVQRFNDIEKLGKYLRELNVSRQNKGGS